MASQQGNVVSELSDLLFTHFVLYMCCSWQAYSNFWDIFGRNLKLGCTEDKPNHKRIAPLLRFYSSKSETALISLDDYVTRMKENQKEIYFLAAESIKSAKNAPFVEDLLKRDLEVGPLHWLRMLGITTNPNIK